MPRADGAQPRLELQRSIEELRGVRGARVEVQGPNVTAIRVLVVPERDTGGTIRDVRRLASQHFDLEVDPDSIEILRVAEPLEKPGARRRRLSGIAIERSNERFHARVVLELDGDVLVGECDSPTERSFEYRSVARATILGLKELLDQDVDLDSVQVMSVGNSRLAVVTLGRGGEILVGCALVRLDDHDAIARATLDAVNRTIAAPAGRRDVVQLTP
jgi:hypothetical protein